MNKMRMESLDMTAQNIEKIGALFPSCITEGRDEYGRPRKAVNFDLLRQLLSADVLEGDEAYEFTWVGKKAAIVEANRPIRKTLRPCLEESVNWDSTQNLYIEGDNLEVLKLLQESYLGKVKMIYIDPPYNTGNDFIYRDDFAMKSEEWSAESGEIDDEGNRLFKNTDTNGRFHSDWCSMIYSRLMLARNLLADDGVIFISIDDHEVDNLRKICDEIFGSECFVANISWQRTYSMRNDSKGIPAELEHILAFSKYPDWKPKELPRTAEMDAKYSNPDNDPDGAWQNTSAFAPGAITHQGMVYAIQNPFTGEMIYPSSGACWRYQQQQMLEYMRGWCDYELKDIHDEHERAVVCGIQDDAIRKGIKAIVLSETLEISSQKAQAVYSRGQWPRFYFTAHGKGGIRRKTYLKNVGGKNATNFWPFSEVGHTDEAKKELMALFDKNAPFDTPKPVRLIDRILSIASDEDSIVLDFFSGSATTAHSVIAKNSEDVGKRKFILVQIPEKISSANYKTICEIGKERIRRAGKKILKEREELRVESEENADSSTLNPQLSTLNTPPSTLDIGFRVLKLDDTNMKDVYYPPAAYDQSLLDTLASNIKEDRSDLDLLFGCLLEWGLPLSLPYKSLQIEGFAVHNYNDGDLIACFDANVTESVIKKIAQMQPLRAVFRDSGFATSPAKINMEEIFKLLAPDTSVKVL